MYKYFVNKAEIYITDSNYTKAGENYKKAFKLNKTPFAKDYYNAVLCAIFNKSVKFFQDDTAKLS